MQNSYFLNFVFLFCVTLSLLFIASSKVIAQTSLTVSIGVGDTVLVLEGKTTPNSLVTFKENNIVIGTATSDANGDFSKTFNPIDSGLHSIDIYSIDIDSNITTTVTQSISVLSNNTTTVSNIILPSTINITPTLLDKGEILQVSGYAVPGSTVTIFIFNSSVTTFTSADSLGAWTILFDTSVLDVGPNQVYSKVQVSGGYQSEISNMLSFIVSNTDTDDDDGDEDSDDDDDEDSILDQIVTTINQLTGLQSSPNFTGSQGGGADNSNDYINTCSLPKFIILFDYDKNCTFAYLEFVDSAFSFIKLWIDKNEPKCDINNDTRCNLTDFSIMLYYVDR